MERDARTAEEWLATWRGVQPRLSGAAVDEAVALVTDAGFVAQVIKPGELVTLERRVNRIRLRVAEGRVQSATWG